MRWILKFIRTGDDPYGPGIFVRVECTEEELQGEKERQAMQFEKAAGREWICANIQQMTERKEGRHDD